jgi:hypothetical protein
MRTPDLISIVYFAYVLLAAILVGGVPARRRLRVALGAAGAVAAVFAASRIWPPHSAVHHWFPAVWLLIGYWLPGGLLHQPQPHLEAWLRASDRWIREWPSMGWARAQPAWLSALFELAYFLVHLFVPTALIVLLLAGLDGSEAFWTPTLLAGYLCYGTLPWLQARPPRVVESPPWSTSGSATTPIGEAGNATTMAPTRVRGWNERVLESLSVRANTFPSGHVAVALAGALVVVDLEPAAGVVFVPIALLIATATVLRRYHYTADVALGVVVAIVCWAGSGLVEEAGGLVGRWAGR